MPSLLCPTKEYLHSYTKAHFQKHGRSLGLTNLWMTKEALVDTIIKTTSERNVANAACRPRTPEHPANSTPDIDEDNSTPSPQDITLDTPNVGEATVTPSPKDTTPSTPDIGVVSVSPCPQDTTPTTLNITEANSSPPPQSIATYTNGSSHQQQVRTTQNVASESDKLQGSVEDQLKTIGVALQDLYSRLGTLEVINRDTLKNEASSHASAVSQPNLTIVQQLSDRLSTLETIVEKDTATQRRPLNQDYERLEQRITALEAAIKVSGHMQSTESQDNTTAHPTHGTIKTPANTLLLGDSNLTNIRTSNLKICRVETIREGNLDLMCAWVREVLDWTPDTCVVYGGYLTYWMAQR